MLEKEKALRGAGRFETKEHKRSGEQRELRVSKPSLRGRDDRANTHRTGAALDSSSIWWRDGVSQLSLFA